MVHFVNLWGIMSTGKGFRVQMTYILVAVSSKILSRISPQVVDLPRLRVFANPLLLFPQDANRTQTLREFDEVLLRNLLYVFVGDIE